MRVYLPATLSSLAAALPARLFPAGPAFAVTPGLRESYASADTDELEYVAMSLAARASVRLIAADPTVLRRRAVVVAEIDPSLVSASAGADRASRGRVTVSQPIPMSCVAAVHVDHEDAIPAVTESALDPDDDFAAGEAADHELLWYATQELDDVVRAAGER
jgi:hypothetical protein